MLIRLFLLTVCFNAIASLLAAQAPATPADLAQLPEAVKTLPWQSIDLSSVPALDYARGLLVMNHVLDELSPLRTSEAELMSTFIDQQALGPALAKNGDAAVTEMSFEDGLKVAIAMLRGPLSGSSYAVELADSSPQSLAAYKQMYERTCQRRWAEVAEASAQVQQMGGFLQKQGKMQDYQSWAKVESENRQL